MASAEREPIMGVWGLCPQWGPVAKPLVRGSGGRSPPEADEFSSKLTQILTQNLQQIWLNVKVF